MANSTVFLPNFSVLVKITDTDFSNSVHTEIVTFMYDIFIKYFNTVNEQHSARYTDLLLLKSSHVGKIEIVDYCIQRYFSVC